ncbi:MAG TPA: serine hydrolase domain-containing protein, partial [Bacteroidia bacterium]|nr:serine hydrolase domain-containing protein [Bacteroidia bacterium]
MKKMFMALCFLSINAIQAQPTFVTDSLNTYIKNAMQQWQIPGMAVAIIKDGKVVLANGCGVANVETKKPVDAYTLFQIA